MYCFFNISIHALREESDGQTLDGDISAVHDFNPRPPRGERPCFGSNHPNLLLISIHALREESDILILRVGLFFFYFNPRPPRGERRS